MKDYYQIMGLPREATAVEIKRSFRQLAIRFHPDKNPSREAEATFKEINEAYEVLSDPEQKLRYDQQLRLEGHAQWQQTYVRPPARPTRPSERTIFMQGMLRYSQMLFYFGCLWSVVLAADYLLPAREIYEVVATDTSERSRLLDAHLADQLRTVEGHHFPLLFSELGYFPPRSRMVIRVSAIFGALISLENFNATYEVNNLGSIYRNLSFAPVLLFLCCAIGLLYRKGLEFHVNLGIVVFLLMILNIVILYRSIL